MSSRDVGDKLRSTKKGYYVYAVICKQMDLFQAKKQARRTTKSFYFLLNTNVPETNNIYISEINDSSVHSFHSFF